MGGSLPSLCEGCGMAPDGFRLRSAGMRCFVLSEV